MSFSQRLGLVPEKQIQINNVDEILKNRLINCFFTDMTQNTIEYISDRIGIINRYDSISLKVQILRYIKQGKWYKIYDIIEYFYYYNYTRICDDCEDFDGNKCDCGIFELKEEFENQINNVLEQEKSGYRMLNGQFAAITNETEVSTIEKASNTNFESVNVCINKALKLYSDRKKPDYDNSIKESIGAVEAMCCIITNMKGKTATLGNAIKKLEENGVVIHKAMKSAFSSLYGYTSDTNGIRHSGIDFTNSQPEDAKYMLVSCSAFVNYLIEKYSKIK